MDDLVEWLRAQLDEDERVATHDGKLRGDQWSALEVSPTKVSWEVVRPGGVVAEPTRWEAEHIARHDPARVLREVKAKRRIMAIHHAREFSYLPQVCDGCGYGGICDDPIVEDINDCPELRALAAIYADSPGYRSEWAPDGV